MILRWKNSHRNIPLSFKFPFYIAITDFLYSSSILIEFVGTISVITWLRVVRECYFEFGKYDYKIWVPIIVISLIIPLSSTNAYGSRNYACGTKIGYDLIGLVVFILIVVTLSTIVFCYLHVLKTIRDIKGHIPSSQVGAVRNSNVESRTFKKVLTYILVFIIQYIPILVYNILMILNIRHIILDALSPAVISLGGIANVFQYLRNEGLKFSYISSNHSSNYKLETTDEKQPDDVTQDV
ncbi:hypothetical protein RclHR1_00390035 [Rhizophagus clarus]|uniref:G-protein coupled receptors family 1 profile domain-containing protein n=1 Tax=Rhizophagus clarus TaxID=94130 RepID=A0A2Z6RF71_9GLOM|nr:hypothetical protein RclHR1_00390035 [Rhizophagus clarus]